MRYNQKRRRVIIYKGHLYSRIKHKAENDFIEYFRDGDMISMEECIEDAIDYYWEEILESDDYYEIKDEDELAELLSEELNYDLDEDEMIENLTCDENYWGLSAYQRNYGLR